MESQSGSARFGDETNFSEVKDVGLVPLETMMAAAAKSPTPGEATSALSVRGDPGMLSREDRGEETGDRAGDAILRRRGKGDESLSSCCRGDDGGVYLTVR